MPLDHISARMTYTQQWNRMTSATTAHVMSHLSNIALPNFYALPYFGKRSVCSSACIQPVIHPLPHVHQHTLFCIAFSEVAIFKISDIINQHKRQIWCRSPPTEYLAHETDTAKVSVECALKHRTYMSTFFAEKNGQECAFVLLQKNILHSSQKVQTSYSNKMEQPHISVKLYSCQ
jgi:hypothetical protein